MKTIINNKIIKGLLLPFFLLMTVVLFAPVITYASADNSLSLIEIKGAKLTPEFLYNRTKYSTTVGADVNKLDIVAKPSNKSAKIIAIRGNDNLQNGNNSVVITVQAQNGNKVNYYINVLKEDGVNNTGNSQNITNDKTNNTLSDNNNSQNSTSQNNISNNEAINNRASIKVKKTANKPKKTVKEINTKEDFQANTGKTIDKEKYSSLLKDYNAIYKERNTLRIVTIVEGIVIILFLLIFIYKGLQGQSFEEEDFDDEDDEDIDDNRSGILYDEEDDQREISSDTRDINIEDGKRSFVNNTLINNVLGEEGNSKSGAVIKNKTDDGLFDNLNKVKDTLKKDDNKDEDFKIEITDL